MTNKKLFAKTMHFRLKWKILDDDEDDDEAIIILILPQ